MEVIKGNKYKVKSFGSGNYFKEKYGTYTPIILIEGLWKEITGKSWMFTDGNPACILYAIRGVDLPIDDDVYYGKIDGLGELIHISELTGA